MANIRFVNSNPVIGADEDDTHRCSNGDLRGHSAQCPWLTIQFGVNELAKVQGGDLHVAQGEYDENVDMSGKQYSNINIIGDLGGKISSPVDAQYCEVRPLVKARNPAKEVFVIKDAVTIKLENLNIAHGLHGVVASRVNPIKLVDCCIRDNEAAKGQSGAGFLLARCRDVLVHGCRVFNNKALTGMGGGGAVTACTNVVIEGSFFHNNEAGLAGGALRMDNSGGDIRIDDTIFGDPHLQILPPGVPSPLANTADFGGAVSLDEMSGTAKFGKTKRNQYLGNRAAHSGGALSVELTTCEIGQDLFRLNQAQQNGGALYLHNSVHVAMEGSDLRENEATSSNGGAIYASGEGAHAGPLPGDLTLSRVELRANKATNGQGGGLCAVFHIKVDVIRSKFIEKNEANAGGGLFYSGGDDNRQIDIRDRSLFTDNIADFRGGGCDITDAQARITDTQFVNNQANTKAGGLSFVGTPAASLELVRCRFRLNKASDGGGAVIEATTTGDINHNEVVGNEGGFHFLTDLMKLLGVKDNVLNGNLSRTGPLEDLISEKDTSKPPLTAQDFATANKVPLAGIIIK